SRCRASMTPSAARGPSTATPASAATTRWPGPRPRRASTRWSASSRSCARRSPGVLVGPGRRGSRGPPGSPGPPGGGGIVGRPMDPRAALIEFFGFDDFRPGQSEAVKAALSDHDALVVMPTGSGKSLCYQLPALMRDDLTIVVSPLVALMRDQAWAIHRIAPGRVTMINSQRSHNGNAEAMARVRRGEVRLLYVAPERFASPAFARTLSTVEVGMFVVDESHCVSEWGHDFRPDYFRLAAIAQSVGARSVMALTATATPRVA